MEHRTTGKTETKNPSVYRDKTGKTMSARWVYSRSVGRQGSLEDVWDVGADLVCHSLPASSLFWLSLGNQNPQLRHTQRLIPLLILSIAFNPFHLTEPYTEVWSFYTYSTATQKQTSSLWPQCQQAQTTCKTNSPWLSFSCRAAGRHLPALTTSLDSDVVSMLLRILSQGLISEESWHRGDKG